MSAHNTLQELNDAPVEVLDPGDGAAIRVDRWGMVVPLVIAASASETNTLPNPTKAGQKLMLLAKTVGSGGTRTITAASAVTLAGDTTIVFNAAGDFAVLESVPAASGYVWRIVSQGGGTAAAGAALTAQLTTISHTAPGTPDYAIQDLTDSSGFGFATKDEGNSVLSVIRNLQVRVGEMEARLQAAGIVE
jgi:hypothetical protein